MFSRKDKIREWNMLIQRYISLHKYLQEVGKKWISQSCSGSVNAEVQIKLGDSLAQIDKALSQLKNFFRSSLTNLDQTDLFVEDRLKIEIQNLIQENVKLKQGTALHQLDEEPARYTQNLESQVQLLQEKNHQLQKKVSELEERCLLLSKGVEVLPSFGIDEIHNNENLQMTLRRKQEQFGETLKAQNDLIEDLKQQLADSNRDKEMFRALNLNLECELQKKNQVAGQNENFLEHQRKLEFEDDMSSQHSETVLDRDIQELLEDKRWHINYQELPEDKHAKEMKPPSYDAAELEKRAEDKDTLQQQIDGDNFTEGKNGFKYEYSDLQQQLHELQLQNEKLQVSDGDLNSTHLQKKDDVLKEDLTSLNTNDQTDLQLEPYSN